MQLNTDSKKKDTSFKNLQNTSSISTQSVIFVDKYLIPKLDRKIKNKFSKNIKNRIIDCSKEVFLYFNNYKPEDVFLVVKKTNESWSIEIKVFPSFKADIELKKYSFVINSISSEKNEFLLNLKEYYLKNFKQVLL